MYAKSALILYLEESMSVSKVDSIAFLSSAGGTVPRELAAQPQGQMKNHPMEF